MNGNTTKAPLTLFVNLLFSCAIIRGYMRSFVKIGHAYAGAQEGLRRSTSVLKTGRLCSLYFKVLKSNDIGAQLNTNTGGHLTGEEFGQDEKVRLDRG